METSINARNLLDFSYLSVSSAYYLSYPLIQTFQTAQTLSLQSIFSRELILKKKNIGIPFSTLNPYRKQRGRQTDSQPACQPFASIPILYNLQPDQSIKGCRLNLISLQDIVLLPLPSRTTETAHEKEPRIINTRAILPLESASVAVASQP